MCGQRYPAKKLNVTIECNKQEINSLYVFIIFQEIYTLDKKINSLVVLFVFYKTKTRFLIIN